MVSIQTGPTARDLLDDRCRVRLTTLLEATSDELRARWKLDGMELSGEVNCLVVGDHVIYKTTDAFDPSDHDMRLGRG